MAKPEGIAHTARRQQQRDEGGRSEVRLQQLASNPGCRTLSDQTCRLHSNFPLLPLSFLIDIDPAYEALADLPRKGGG